MYKSKSLQSLSHHR